MDGLLKLIFEYASKHPDLMITFYNTLSESFVFRFMDMKAMKTFSRSVYVRDFKDNKYPEGFLKEIFKEAEYKLYLEEQNADKN